MPIANAHPFAEVIDAVAEHATLTGLAPLWAVTPLANVNDDFADGAALGETARAFWERTGVRPRVTVIPYNSIDEHSDPFYARQRTTTRRVRARHRVDGVSRASALQRRR